MYLSRCSIIPDVVRSPDFFRIAGGMYQIHRMVWDLFAEESVTERDFLYRVDTTGKLPFVYTVSAREPVYLGNVWDVRTKPYTPNLSQGQRLSFVLRANPTRKKKTGEDGKGQRHDVVMDAKKALKESGEWEKLSQRLAELIQQEGYRWMASRAEGLGFSLHEGEVITSDYRQHQFRQGRKNREVSITTLDFSGMLTVEDPTAFERALFSGIGPAKGFGCGLLLIKNGR